MESLYIVIPAYNEQENIEQVVEGWYPIIEQYHGDGASRLIIIDDGSKDDTYGMMQKLAEKRPLFLPLTKPNGGHGATVLYGYQYALEQGADFVFQTDSDGQTLPEEFHAFWAQKQDYDMIIGNRASREDGFSRVFVTKTLKAVVALLFHEQIPDANTPFRLMRGTALRDVVRYIPEDYNLSNVIVAVVFQKMGLRVKYTPITFRPRQGGVNSINLKRIFAIGKKAIGDFRVINQNLAKIPARKK